jgi:hypothetical protein
MSLNLKKNKSVQSTISEVEEMDENLFDLEEEADLD